MPTASRISGAGRGWGGVCSEGGEDATDSNKKKRREEEVERKVGGTITRMQALKIATNFADTLMRRISFRS